MYRPPPAGSAGSAVLASLCAGPVFVLTMVLSVLTSGTDAWTGAGAMLVVVPVAVPFGFIVALLPNLLGSAALHRLGRSNDAARLPVFWALAGGLLAGGTALACRAPGELAGLFAATGTACALVCRWGADWP